MLFTTGKLLVIALFLLMGLFTLGQKPACASTDGPAPGGPGYCAPLDKIADAVLANPNLKPLTRKAISPKNPEGLLQFDGQQSLTKPLVEAYLDRSISHMNAWDDRSVQFINESGAKFIHWADLGWGRLYTADDWKQLTDTIDKIHSIDGSQDIIFECGIMEITSLTAMNATPIPDWMLKILDDLGLQDKRKVGPNGKNYFCYESMFDRNATNWPKRYVGEWDKNPASESSVPDLTMLETQLYYAYVAAEYIDAGFEGILFGQAGLTGKRDTGNISMNNICEFAKKWAAARAYRHAVTLSSHVLNPPEYSSSPNEKPKPLYTHLSFPTRMIYTNDTPIGMMFSPYLEASGRRQGGKQLLRVLNLPHDLPILLEIDNYAPTKGPSPVCDEGYDEITAYANKNREQRAAFLQKYYFMSRQWCNVDGNARMHFALPGYRCMNAALSLHVLETGERSKPTSCYLPYKEDGGEEVMIKELFKMARNPEDFKKLDSKTTAK